MKKKFDFRLQMNDPIEYRGVVWRTWFFRDTPLSMNVAATTGEVNTSNACDTDIFSVAINGGDFESAYRKCLSWVNARLARPRKERPGHCSTCSRAAIWRADKNGKQNLFDPIIEDGKTVMRPHAHPIKRLA